jgi:hypothetical protein
MTLSTRGFGSGGLFLLAAAVMLTSGAVSAGPITGPLTGTFGFDGPGVLTFNSGADFIDFCSTVTGTTCNNNGTGTGDFTVTGPGSGSFTGLLSTTTGTIDDLTDATPPATGYTYLPVGVPVAIDNIIALNGFSTWDFEATLLPLATCGTPPTPSQVCLGAFQLNQNGSNVSVEMNIDGKLINTTGGGSSTTYTDLAITGNFLGTTIAAVEEGAVTPAGVFSDNWSASVTAVTPEPPTSMMMLLAGCGLILLSRLRRSRR